jgi:hypothetical protein
MKTKISISKRNLILFGVPILGLLLGLLGNFALVAPQKSKAQQLDSQLQAAQAQLVASHKKVVTKPRKVAKRQSVQAADIFRLSKAMPDSNDMPGILVDLSRLAQASSITVQSVTPAAQVPLATGYAALPLSVVVSGKFDEVASFLKRLREQAALGKNDHPLVQGRLFVTNGVDLTSSDGRTVSATLSLDAFVYGAGIPVVPAVGATGASGTTTTKPAA